jgi:hypothetical protein
MRETRITSMFLRRAKFAVPLCARGEKFFRTPALGALD